MIIHVARRLGVLRDKVVFVGGCATELFITDPAMPEVRAPQDVDVIAEVASRVEYYGLEEELRSRGFKKDMSENAPVCRWLVDAIRVDIMPTQEDILGFSNRWYLPAIKNADPIELEKELWPVTTWKTSSRSWMAVSNASGKGRIPRCDSRASATRSRKPGKIITAHEMPRGDIKDLR
jgi:hypothetical protein